MKKMSILLLFLLLWALPGSAFAASIVDSGTCGTDLTWTLDSDGLLTISGTGSMSSYCSERVRHDYHYVPDIVDWPDDWPIDEDDWDDEIVNYMDGYWSSEYYYDDEGQSGSDYCDYVRTEITLNFNSPFSSKAIKTVVICDGVTSIGEGAFNGCSMTSITIPASVTSIGRYAFPSGNYSYSEEREVEPSEDGEFDSIYYDVTEEYYYTVNSKSVNNLADVYYEGTPDQWHQIHIACGNDALTGANLWIPNAKITQQPANVVAPIGTVASFHVEAEGSGLCYQWYYKSPTASRFNKCTSASGSTDTYSITLNSRHDGYQYYCVVTSYSGNSVISDTVTVHLGQTLQIAAQPVDYIGDIGSTVSFTVEATGESPTYQWYYKQPSSSSFTKCTSASGTTQSYSITMNYRHIGYKYYCVVTDRYGNSITSDTVTIHRAASIVNQPVDYYGPAGSTISFHVGVAGEGLSYQWYFKKPNDSYFVKSTLTSGKKATYTMTMADKNDGWQYYCIVSDKYGNTVMSDTVTVHKYQPVCLTSQPQDVTSAIGNVARFSVGAVGSGLTYQWYYKTPTASDFKKCTSATGTTAAYSITLNAKHEGYKYYCVVTDSQGYTVTTNTVTVHLGNALKIIDQPVDFTGQAGSSIRFCVNASGDGLTYQWYYKKPGGSSFVKSTLASGTKAIYTMKMADKYDGWQYYCIVTDKYGKSVQSDTVTVHKRQIVSITSQPVDYYGAVGSTIKFTVDATGDGLSYQWYYKKPGGSSFVKSTLASGNKATYTMTMADKYDGWLYRCIVTDAYGNNTVSDTVAIHLSSPLKITGQPVDFTGAIGDMASYTVKATGDLLTYQWYYKSPKATKFSKSTSASGLTSTYSIKLASSHDGYQYYCIVTDAAGNSLRSNTVTAHLK